MNLLTPELQQSSNKLQQNRICSLSCFCSSVFTVFHWCCLNLLFLDAFYFIYLFCLSILLLSLHKRPSSQQLVESLPAVYSLILLLLSEHIKTCSEGFLLGLLVIFPQFRRLCSVHELYLTPTSMNEESSCRIWPWILFWTTSEGFMATSRRNITFLSHARKFDFDYAAYKKMNLKNSVIACKMRCFPIWLFKSLTLTSGCCSFILLLSRRIICINQPAQLSLSLQRKYVLHMPSSWSSTNM